MAEDGRLVAALGAVPAKLGGVPAGRELAGAQARAVLAPKHERSDEGGLVRRVHHLLDSFLLALSRERLRAFLCASVSGA